MIDQIKSLENEPNIIGYLEKEIQITKHWVAERAWDQRGWVPGAESLIVSENLKLFPLKTVTVELAGSPCAGKSTIAWTYQSNSLGMVHYCRELFPYAVEMTILQEQLKATHLNSIFDKESLTKNLNEASMRLHDAGEDDRQRLAKSSPLFNRILYREEDASKADPFLVELFKLQGHQDIIRLRDFMAICNKPGILTKEMFERYIQLSPIQVERYVFDQLIFKWASLMEGKISLDNFHKLSNDTFDRAISLDDKGHVFVLALFINPPSISIERREKEGKDGKFIRSPFIERLFWLYLTLHRWIVTAEKLPDNFVYLALDSSKNVDYLYDVFEDNLDPIIDPLGETFQPDGLCEEA